MMNGSRWLKDLLTHRYTCTQRFGEIKTVMLIYVAVVRKDSGRF